jgi:lysophospholipase L1-like esterase
MNTFDQPPVRWLIYHLLGGDVFYASMALLIAAGAMRIAGSWRPMYRWRKAARLFVILGLIGTASSLSAVTLRWLAPLGMVALTAAVHRDHRRQRAVMSVVAAALVVLAVVLTWRYETAGWTLPQNPKVIVLADSLGSDFQVKKNETWPLRLAAAIGAPVDNGAVPGAKIETALDLLNHVKISGHTVIIALGGNDFLSGTPLNLYTRQLDELLTRLLDDGNRVVLLEVPAPPNAPWYGWAQQVLAGRHEITLLPNRVLADVLFNTPGSTLDGLHLTPTGHEKMATALAARLRK